MKFLDLFAGIGGFRLGMEAAGHQCVGFCEVDGFARKSYKAIFNTEKEVELHDIRSVPDESIRGLGQVDILCGGFPCQSFSLAGSRRGFRDERGNLFFEVARFAKLLRPSYIFLENVPGLLSHGGGDTFETILSTLDALGYNVEWQVLNSSHFGVPQNRQRIFLVGHSRRRGTQPIFPLGSDNREVAELPEIRTNSLTAQYPGGQGNGSYIVESKPKRVGNIHPSGKGMNGDIYSVEGTAPTLTTNKGEGMKIVLSGKLPGKYSITNRLYDTSGIAPTLSTMQGGGQEPKIIQRSHGFNKGGEYKIAPTLTSHSYQENNLVKIVDFYNKIVKDEVGTLTSSGGGSTVRTGSFGVTDGYRIRKLTPRECWRLQGFPDWAFDKACYGEVIPQGYFDLLLSRKLSRKKWQKLWRITRKQRMSNSQLYKQAGNSVTVPVIAAIAKCFS
jgi:DNA (cytosine-5-)-methyltransferase